MPETSVNQVAALYTNANTEQLELCTDAHDLEQTTHTQSEWDDGQDPNPPAAMTSRSNVVELCAFAPWEDELGRWPERRVRDLAGRAA